MAIEALAGLAAPIRSLNTPLSGGDPSTSSTPATIISQDVLAGRGAAAECAPSASLAPALPGWRDAPARRFVIE